MMRVAVLDDWQGIAPESTDWSRLRARAELVFFDRPLGDTDQAAATLAEFDAVIAMRERQPFPATLIARLPRLKLIALTGRRAPSLDVDACTAHGVLVCNTGGNTLAATAELALALMLAAMRDIPAADAAVRAGRFQQGVRVGDALEGRTLGIVGLGRLGSRMAQYGRALGMRLLAWSQNLTEARAQEAGATLVPKERLLAESDVVTLHVVLSARTRGLIGEAEIARMKPGALLVNTSRGPVVDEAALARALHAGRIRAALDVFGEEPLTPSHPLFGAPNTVFTPHLGYGTSAAFAQFYAESVENVLAFLDGAPVRMVNPEALSAAQRQHTEAERHPG